MVRLIIRDDDCNYFTRPEDIERVYSQIPDFPVSFATVPTIMDVAGGCPETKGNITPRGIGDNAELVSYLKKRYEEGKCDILLHGITHGYHYRPDGSKIPEMIWRNDEGNLREQIKNSKQYLEDTFDLPITCFVAPSNQIMKNGIRAVYENGLNYSGIIPISFQRDVDFKSIGNYVKRIWVRATKKIPYPQVMVYSTHKELNACNTVSFEYLKKMFEYCKRLDSPLAINVHYWHMRDYQENYKGFFDFIHYALDNGALPARMRDCL